MDMMEKGIANVSKSHMLVLDEVSWTLGRGDSWPKLNLVLWPGISSLLCLSCYCILLCSHNPIWCLNLRAETGLYTVRGFCLFITVSQQPRSCCEASSTGVLLSVVSDWGSSPVTTNLQSSSASCRPLLILTHNLDHVSFPFLVTNEYEDYCLKRKLLIDISGYLCSQANLIDIQHETQHA